MRKVRHVWDGGRGNLATIRETVRSETSIPSLRNSPWIRGAPHSGFADAILSMSARIAATVLGRPDCFCRDRSVQRRRSHWRCQRTTVSACTMSKAPRQPRQALANTIQKNRSHDRRRGRLVVRVNAANAIAAFRIRSDGSLAPLPPLTGTPAGLVGLAGF